MLCGLPDNINDLVGSNLVVAHKAEVTGDCRVLRQRLVLTLFSARFKQLRDIKLSAVNAACHIVCLGNCRVELAHSTYLNIAGVDVSASAGVVSLVIVNGNETHVNYQSVHQFLNHALYREEILLGTVCAKTENVGFDRKLLISGLEYSAQFKEARFKVSRPDVGVCNRHQ